MYLCSHFRYKYFKRIMISYKDWITELFGRIGQLKDERPTAGTRWRLMGVAADVAEVTELLQTEVLEQVRNEVVLDADADMDYQEVAEQVMAAEMEAKTEELREATEQVNAALGALNTVLADIDRQLLRHHHDDEYVRLYESEKRRYLKSGTARRARQTFEEWRENQNNGNPTLDDIEDYRMGKVLKLFGKGVFSRRVEQTQRTRRYPGELDFDLLDDDHPLRRTAYRHYAVLRKMVDWQDGLLVVNAARVGQHFYTSRHDDNAKTHRSTLLKYLHKIEMVQEERARLMAAQKEEEAERQSDEANLNYFAPKKHLKALLEEEWFELHRTDKRYDQQWTQGFVDKLMQSEHRDTIATEWGKDKRQDYIRGCVLGLLKEGGVIKGSMDSIARSANVCDNYRTFSKYMGQCRQAPYADWVLDYITRSE